MELKDFFALLHPILAVTIVFPLIGVVSYFALKTRQRRLETAAKVKSKIPPLSGPEHLRLGRWLTLSVVGVSLLGLAFPLASKMLSNGTWGTEPFRVVFVWLIFGLTAISLIFLNQAKTRLWRGVFATLTGAGLVILGCQPEIFRRGYEWYVSHYYIGMTAAMLMIISQAIVQDIYQDKTLRWRRVHIGLNIIALLLFFGQGMTGARDLLEIPLGWQEKYIYQCDFDNKTCPAFEQSELNAPDLQAAAARR